MFPVQNPQKPEAENDAAVYEASKLHRLPEIKQREALPRRAAVKKPTS